MLRSTQQCSELQSIGPASLTLGITFPSSMWGPKTQMACLLGGYFCQVLLSGTSCQPVSPRWGNDSPAFSLEVSSPKFSPPSAAFVKLQRLVSFHHYSCNLWNFSDFKGFCPKYPLWVQDRTHVESGCSLVQTKAGIAGDVGNNRCLWALNTRQRSGLPPKRAGREEPWRGAAHWWRNSQRRGCCVGQ